MFLYCFTVLCFVTLTYTNFLGSKDIESSLTSLEGSSYSKKLMSRKKSPDPVPVPSIRTDTQGTVHVLLSIALLTMGGLIDIVYILLLF